MSQNDSQACVDGLNVSEGHTDPEFRSSSLDSGAAGFDDSDFLPAFTFNLPRSAKVFSSVTDAYLHYATLAIKHLEAVIRPGAEFHFSPILVAENVSSNVLDEIPTMVKSYRVKCQVIESRLFILDLSCGPVHGAGVANLLEQMGAWRTGHTTPQLFSSTTDSTYANGASSAAPDVVLKASTAYGEEEEQRKIGMYVSITSHSIYHLNYSLVFVFVVIIELEVSNRSVPAIRRDFMSYFNNDAELHSVIAIKVFNTGERELECLYFPSCQFNSDILDFRDVSRPARRCGAVG